VAAGFDKDARVADGLALLGFGHVEIGTLTPRPQTGNERPRIFRLPQDHALINRMGFPNDGVEAVVARLRQMAEARRHFVLGVSLGKQKETPLEEAAGDYAAVMREVYPYADYLAVNISSPNTPGLRALQGGDYLENLLAVLVAESTSLAVQHYLPRRPLLVKIAPDLGWSEVDEILAAVTTSGVDGLIATNTTTGRHGLSSPAQGESGGLSGRPLRDRSNEIIAYVSAQTGGRLAIIGVGGVFGAADVQAKLDAGASLVQLYTALVYEGPGLPGRILSTL
jgi:dihydroorotate dehydrogenase